MKLLIEGGNREGSRKGTAAEEVAAAEAPIIKLRWCGAPAAAPALALTLPPPEEVSPGM